MKAVWVMGAPGLPCGARELGDSALGPAAPGRVWLDVCVIGQHLPQMYREDEMQELKAGGCERLGLCPDCLGFGDISPRRDADALNAALRGVDRVQPCAGCGGSGRPAVRVTVQRSAAGVTGTLRPVPHEYVPPLGDSDRELLAAFQVSADMCLACGEPPDGTVPNGKAVHR